MKLLKNILLVILNLAQNLIMLISNYYANLNSLTHEFLILNKKCMSKQVQVDGTIKNKAFSISI